MGRHVGGVGRHMGVGGEARGGRWGGTWGGGEAWLEPCYCVFILGLEVRLGCLEGVGARQGQCPGGSGHSQMWGSPDPCLGASCPQLCPSEETWLLVILSTNL